VTRRVISWVLPTPVAFDHEANAVSIRLEDRGRVIGCPSDINQNVHICPCDLAEAEQIYTLSALIEASL
jgi:hypothetical protein